MSFWDGLRYLNERKHENSANLQYFNEIEKNHREIGKGFLHALAADATPRVDLGIAYPVGDDLVGLTLTVAGKPQRFEMTRSAAASFAGRIAEALAK